MATKYKDSGIYWIEKVPIDWKLVPAKRIFNGCKRIVGDKANDYDRLALTMQGVIKRSKDDNDGLQPEKFDGYQILKENELVFKLIDLQNEKTSRVGLSPYDGIVSPAYLILSNQSTDNRYYYYWFIDMYYRLIFNQMADDGVRSALNIKDLLEIPIPNITLPTQQRIADFLDRKCAEIDELAALQETMIEELKRYKQSLITETVTKGLNPNAQMKDSGVEWIGEIPEGWKIRRLKFVANRRNEKADDSTLKYIGLEHIVGFSKEMVETENVYDNEGANMCYDRDVIFGKLRPYLGKAKVIEDTCCCSSEFLVLCNVHCPDYLRYLILSGWFIEIVNASTYGTKMPRANADFIMNMLIPVPHTNEQQQIADYLDRKCAEIDELIAIKQQKIEALKEYKKSVIFEYVTGKKEI